MLTALVLALVFVMPVLVVVALAQAVEGRRRARARLVASQIRLTDAVHAELGAVVAPFVEKPVFRPWRVIFPVRDVRATDVSRLVSIAERVLTDDVRAREPVQIVFTRPAPRPRPHAA